MRGARVRALVVAAVVWGGLGEYGDPFWASATAATPALPGSRASVAPRRLAVAVAEAGDTVAVRAAAAVDDETVRRVAAQLRCVVCQNLSVLDSPSEMAAQMRAIIRERLASGETPDQIVQYFVAKYGEWILLSPPRRGFTLLVWMAPLASVLVGLAVVAFLLRRWTRPRAVRTAVIDPKLRERVRRELKTPP